MKPLPRAIFGALGTENKARAQSKLQITSVGL